MWTNKAAISAIDRTRPVTITWAGGSLPGYVLIGGGVHVTGSGSTAFLCSEESQMGTFTVPSFVLGSLPAAEPANGTLFIGASPLSNIISVPGLDFTVLVDGSSDYKSIAVR